MPIPMIPDDAVPPAPAPASPGARAPLVVNAGTIVARAFGVWREHLGRFLVLNLALMVPVLVVVVGLAAMAVDLNLDRAGSRVPLVVVGVVVTSIVFALVAAGIAGITHGAIQGLAGRPVQLGAMFRAGFRSILPTIGAGLVVGLGVVVGGVMLVVPGVILACGLSAVMGAVVTERLGPIEALKRSWALTDGHKVSVLGAAVLMFFANVGLMVAATLLELVPVVGALASLGLNLLTSSLNAIWPAVVYHDLRLLKEGSGTGEEDLARVFE